MIEARRLRHCVVRSAFSSDKKTDPVEGSARLAGGVMVRAGDVGGESGEVVEAGEIVDITNYLVGGYLVGGGRCLVGGG